MEDPGPLPTVLHGYVLSVVGRVLFANLFGKDLLGVLEDPSRRLLIVVVGRDAGALQRGHLRNVDRFADPSSSARSASP